MCTWDRHIHTASSTFLCKCFHVRIAVHCKILYLCLLFLVLVILNSLYYEEDIETQHGLPCHFWPGGYLSSFLSTVLLSIPSTQQMLVEFLGLGPRHLPVLPTPQAILSLLNLSYFLHGSFHDVKCLYVFYHCVFICLLLSLFHIDCKLQQKTDRIFCSAMYAHLPGTMSGTWKERQLLIEPVSA